MPPADLRTHLVAAATAALGLTACAEEEAVIESEGAAEVAEDPPAAVSPPEVTQPATPTVAAPADDGLAPAEAESPADDEVNALGAAPERSPRRRSDERRGPDSIVRPSGGGSRGGGPRQEAICGASCGGACGGEPGDGEQ